MSRLLRGFSQGISEHAAALRLLEDCVELERLRYPQGFVRALLHSLPSWMAATRAAQRVYRRHLAFAAPSR